MSGIADGSRVGQHLDHLGGEQLGLRFIEFAGGLTGLEDGGLDLAGVEIGFAPIAFLHLEGKIEWGCVWVAGHFHLSFFCNFKTQYIDQ